MATDLRIRRLRLLTATDEASYDFHDGVNAVVGPIGTGKSSMLELIKYGLGGSAQIMPAVHDNVRTVELRVLVGDQTLDLKRAMDARLVDVHDATSGELIGTWSTFRRKKHRRAAEELLSRLGLPDDLRVPRRRTRPDGATVPLSFFDIYRYLYLSQNTIDLSVVGHTDTNLDNKRRAVFELLYQLTNPRLLEVVSQRGRLALELEHARTEARTIASFLQQIEGLGEEALRLELAGARRLLAEQEATLAELKSSQATNEADPLSQEVATLRVTTNTLGRQIAELDDAIADAQAVLAQLALDEEAFHRTDAASRSLSGIDFVVCPRCLQSVKDRQAPAHHCSLCLQPQVDTSKARQPELRRIQEQRREVQSVIAADQRDRDTAQALLRTERQRLDELIFRLYEREQGPETEVQLLSVEDAARAASSTHARIQSLLAALGRWSALRDREAEVASLGERIKELRAEETQLKLALQETNERVAQLSQTFDDIIRNFNMPWYQRGDIDPKTYLPRLGGIEFDRLSVGGARKTLVNLAFHIANLMLSIEEYDVALPSLLIVDSPRKNVGENENDRAVAEAIYRRFRMLQDASPRAFQVIVADNDLPTSTSEWLRTPIRLTYDDPLVPGVEHPGESVETIASAPPIEDE